MVVGQVCDSGIGITWLQVARHPVLHLDKMTNGNAPCSLINLCVSVCLVDKISLVNI